MPLLTTRATIYLDAWNAGTMWETRGVFQIASEMSRYNMEVLGISKTHWTQVGKQRLASGELLLYCGYEGENAPHTQGVALMLSKQAQYALIGWESHGPMIIKASFKTKKEGISMDLLKEEETTMEDNWKGIEQALTPKCQEVLDWKKHHHKEWNLTETLDKIKERKNKKTAISNS
ncbi:unnamed protein product [Schistosoma curassoni]|uniref:Flavodoxin-like domain-containing protein n=1 Tax=Schistosoma curassoni TaxID=6186 RepID=A0A183KAC9_9TREM|nr:unnamed protein product [Schistosoma curassoni]